MQGRHDPTDNTQYTTAPKIPLTQKLATSMSTLRVHMPNMSEDVEVNMMRLGSNNTSVFEQVEEGDIDLTLPRFQRICQQVQSTFGFNVKRYQAGVIADILEAKRDVFVIAGTGSGKSLIYQILPYLLKDKIFLVVCPTLALMSDQV